MKNKMTVKRVAALLAVVLLAALYLVTLLAAVFDTAEAGSLFRICLICTVAVPLFAWIFIWIYGQFTGKSTIADVHLLEDPQDYRKQNKTDTVDSKMAEEATDENK